MYRFITGEIKFKVSSARCESVINMLRCTVPVNKIKMVEENTFEFITGYRYRKAVVDICEKCNSKLEIVQANGLPVLFDRYKKRAGLWVGALLSAVTLILSSCIIWEVRVSGNTYVSDTDIIGNLKKLGISEGEFINKKDLEKIYNSFLINEPRISWISVNFDGTVAKVEVKETEIVPERTDRSKNINIIAKCDGIIRRADVFDGKAEVSKNEAVTKGQLLISSFTETRKNGIFMRAARGNVWASTIHHIEITIKKDSIKAETVSTMNKRSILVLGRRIPLYLRGKTDETSEHYVSIERFSLFGRFNFPLQIENENIQLRNYVETVLTVDEARTRAEAELERRIGSLITDGRVVDMNLNCGETDNEYVFVYELYCYENIGMPVEFEFVGK